MNRRRFRSAAGRLQRELALRRRAFIWRWGVLRVGVPFAVALALYDEVWQGEHILAPAWLSVIVRLVLYLFFAAPFFGILWGWMMWGWLSNDGSPPSRATRDSTA